MNGTYLGFIWILMNGIWSVGLCCSYSHLFTLHWRTWWWFRRCISYFWPRQHLLSIYFASHQCNQGSLQPLFGRHWCRPVFLHSEDIDVNLFFSTARARVRAGAAMCMRSTPSCGTLAAPSLVLVDFRSPKPQRSAGIPGLKRLGALGRPGRPGSVQPTRKSPAEVTCINQGHISMLRKTCFWRDCVMPPA